MGGEGAGGWTEVQPPVPRSDSLPTKVSDAAWGSGIETFFLHAVPFSYGTGKSFALRMARLGAFALLLGLAHRKLGELDLAEDRLRKALTICPHYRLAYAELGHVLLRQGRQEEHLEAVIESLSCYPDDGVWEQVVSAVIGLLVQGRAQEANSAMISILKTAEHHAALVPDYVVRRLVALQRG